MVPFLYVGLALALVGAAAIIVFESAVRSAAGLITVFVGVAAATAALGTELVPGSVLWIGGGGIGLPMLACVLLLNLGVEERGARRFRVRPALAMPVVVVLWIVLASLLMNAVPEAPAAKAPSAADVARVIASDLALPFCAALLALVATAITAIALVRRRT
jgi:NADH:ubiquinone oxidoreductase subunit 6 (subunit J)